MKKGFVLSFLFSWVAFAHTYDCELKARSNLMENFAVEKIVYEGGITPARVKLKDFELIVQSLKNSEGEETLSLWLGQSDYYSAVTQVPYGAPRAYLNLVQGHPFAVASCDLLQD